MGDRNPPANLQALDLARTLAILPVLALHMTGRLFPDQALPPLWDHFQRNGAYGVSLFFMISGFLITRTLDLSPGGAFRAGWRRFYARRAGRILPLLFFDVALGLALWRILSARFHPGFAYSFNLPLRPDDPGFWIPLCFFAFNWARALWALNVWGAIGVHWGVLWSLAVEEQFYLFYPLLLRLLGRPRNLAFFLLALVGAGFGWRWFVYLQPLDNGLDWKWGSFGYFDQLGLGIGLYFGQKRWGRALGENPGAAWALFILGAAAFLASYGATSCGRLLDLFYGPFLAAASAALALGGALNLPCFESRLLAPLALPGKYSYGNYLFHATALFLIAPGLGGKGPFTAFLAFTAASTALAALSYHFFEVPANRWVRAKLHAA